MSSPPGNALALPVRPVSALTGREFIDAVERAMPVRVDAVLPADTEAA